MLDCTVWDPDGAGALTALVELRDPHALARGRDVMFVCEQVGQRLGMAAAEVDDLRLAARFHDVGKLAIRTRS